MNSAPLNLFIIFPLAFYPNGFLGFFFFNLRVEPLKVAPSVSHRSHKLAVHRPHPASGRTEFGSQSVFQKEEFIVSIKNFYIKIQVSINKYFYIP